MSRQNNGTWKSFKITNQDGTIEVLSTISATTLVTTLNLVTRLHQLCFPNDTLYKSLNMMIHLLRLHDNHIFNISIVNLEYNWGAGLFPDTTSKNKQIWLASSPSKQPSLEMIVRLISTFSTQFLLWWDFGTDYKN